MSALDTPRAPCSIARATIFCICSSWAAAGSTSPNPTTIARTVAAPTNVPRLMDARNRRK